MEKDCEAAAHLQEGAPGTVSATSDTPVMFRAAWRVIQLERAVGTTARIGPARRRATVTVPGVASRLGEPIDPVDKPNHRPARVK